MRLLTIHDLEHHNPADVVKFGSQNPHYREIKILAQQLKANQDATNRLCELNPKMADRYREANILCRAEIAEQIKKLRVFHSEDK